MKLSKGFRLWVAIGASLAFLTGSFQVAHAWEVYHTGTYITTGSYVSATGLLSGWPNNLTVEKQAGLLSSYSPSNICKSGTTPNFKTTSNPWWATIGANFGGNYSFSGNYEQGDTRTSSGEAGDTVYDTNQNGTVFDNYTLSWPDVLPGRSTMVTITHAIAYLSNGSCVSESFSDSVWVNSY